MTASLCPAAKLKTDQRLFYHVRRVILEFGGRLAQAGALDEVKDVFYLTADQLQNGQDVPMKRIVQQRKTEMERFASDRNGKACSDIGDHDGISCGC